MGELFTVVVLPWRTNAVASLTWEDKLKSVAKARIAEGGLMVNKVVNG